MKLLVSNVGSTSLKFKLFDMPEERVLCEAKIERVGSRDAAIMSYRSHLSGARFSAEGLCIPSYAEGIALFLEKLTGGETGVIKGVEEISAIGFKTVLSRGYYGVHELTDEVMENMREYLYIAPVHNAAYIEAIGQFKAVLPDVPMIGVFETAFHREIPLERALYSIPYEWYENTASARWAITARPTGTSPSRRQSSAGRRESSPAILAEAAPSVRSSTERAWTTASASPSRPA